MAKNDSVWASLAIGLQAASILLGSLLLGGLTGWFLEKYLVPTWNPWPTLAGLMVGLMTATVVLLKQSVTRKG